MENETMASYMGRGLMNSAADFRDPRSRRSDAYEPKSVQQWRDGAGGGGSCSGGHLSSRRHRMKGRGDGLHGEHRGDHDDNDEDVDDAGCRRQNDGILLLCSGRRCFVDNARMEATAAATAAAAATDTGSTTTWARTTSTYNTSGGTYDGVCYAARPLSTVLINGRPLSSTISNDGGYAATEFGFRRGLMSTTDAAGGVSQRKSTGDAVTSLRRDIEASARRHIVTVQRPASLRRSSRAAQGIAELKATLAGGNGAGSCCGGGDDAACGGTGRRSGGSEVPPPDGKKSGRHAAGSSLYRRHRGGGIASDASTLSSSTPCTSGPSTFRGQFLRKGDGERGGWRSGGQMPGGGGAGGRQSIGGESMASSSGGRDVMMTSGSDVITDCWMSVVTPPGLGTRGRSMTAKA